MTPKNPSRKVPLNKIDYPFHDNEARAVHLHGPGLSVTFDGADEEFIVYKPNQIDGPHMAPTYRFASPVIAQRSFLEKIGGSSTAKAALVQSVNAEGYAVKVNNARDTFISSLLIAARNVMPNWAAPSMPFASVDDTTVLISTKLNDTFLTFSYPLLSSYDEDAMKPVAHHYRMVHGSDRWKEYRAFRLTSTDLAAALGKSKYMTVEEWKEKKLKKMVQYATKYPDDVFHQEQSEMDLSSIEHQNSQARMQWGLRHEPEIIKRALKLMGVLPLDCHEEAKHMSHDKDLLSFFENLQDVFYRNAQNSSSYFIDLEYKAPIHFDTPYEWLYVFAKSGFNNLNKEKVSSQSPEFRARYYWRSDDGFYRIARFSDLFAMGLKEKSDLLDYFDINPNGIQDPHRLGEEEWFAHDSYMAPFGRLQLPMQGTVELAHFFYHTRFPVFAHLLSDVNLESSLWTIERINKAIRTGFKIYMAITARHVPVSLFPKVNLLKDFGNALDLGITNSQVFSRNLGRKAFHRKINEIFKELPYTDPIIAYSPASLSRLAERLISGDFASFGRYDEEEAGRYVWKIGDPGNKFMATTNVHRRHQLANQFFATYEPAAAFAGPFKKDQLTMVNMGSHTIAQLPDFYSEMDFPVIMNHPVECPQTGLFASPDAIVPIIADKVFHGEFSQWMKNGTADNIPETLMDALPVFEIQPGSDYTQGVHEAAHPKASPHYDYFYMEVKTTASRKDWSYLDRPEYEIVIVDGDAFDGISNNKQMIPKEYWWQCQASLYITGKFRMLLCVLIQGSIFRMYDVIASRRAKLIIEDMFKDPQSPWNEVLRRAQEEHDILPLPTLNTIYEIPNVSDENENRED